jgi:hypothetical protein
VRSRGALGSDLGFSSLSMHSPKHSPKSPGYDKVTYEPNLCSTKLITAGLTFWALLP